MKKTELCNVVHPTCDVCPLYGKCSAYGIYDEVPYTVPYTLQEEKSFCYGCRYYAECGDPDRTEICNGKEENLCTLCMEDFEINEIEPCEYFKNGKCVSPLCSCAFSEKEVFGDD